jgi:hypothetical protein
MDLQAFLWTLIWCTHPKHRVGPLRLMHQAALQHDEREEQARVL